MYDNAVVSEVDWVRGVGVAAVDVGLAVRVEASVVNAADEPILKQSARLVPNIMKSTHYYLQQNVHELCIFRVSCHEIKEMKICMIECCYQ